MASTAPDSEPEAIPSPSNLWFGPKRLLDKFYVVYFISVIFIALLIDFQPLYPPEIVPKFLKDVAEDYAATSGDPMVGRRLGGIPQMAW